MEKPPRGADETLITPWLFFRYMVIGVYVGAATVGSSSYWFLFDPTGPQMSFWQLTNHMQCYGQPEDFKGISCEIFQAHRCPSGSSPTTCSAMDSQKTSKESPAKFSRHTDVLLAAHQPHAVLWTARRLQRNLLRNFPGTRSHDHGSVCPRHHRDVQCS